MRTITDETFDDWYSALELAFGESDSPEERALFRETTEFPRTFGLFDGNRPVSSAGAFSFRLTVPGGGSVPAGGVTAVSVAPTHRRRGVLTAMMRRQLDDFRDRGEPVGVLTASEPAIYGRFGYAAATWELAADAPRHQVRVVSPLGHGLRLRLADPVESLPQCAALYRRVGAQRPGWLDRPAGWERQAVLDPPSRRGNGTPLLCVLAEDPDGSGELRGYAYYRVVPGGGFAGAAATVLVREVYADGPDAEAALWRYLFATDLATTVSVKTLPPDTALRHLVDDPRRLGLRLRESLYVRLVDLPTALTARRYSAPVDAVLDVADLFCPWNQGRWRLHVDASGTAECTPAPAATRPDAVLSVNDLATVYLGGDTLLSRAASGHATGDPATLTALSTAFATPRLPWLPRGF